MTTEIVEVTKTALAKKKPSLDLSKVRLETITEGLCVQVMHIGSYDEEPDTIAALDRYAGDNGYALDMGGARRHHEMEYYGIWAVRGPGSVMGAAEAWSKRDGVPEVFTSKAEAQAQAEQRNKNVRSAHVHYYVKEMEPELAKSALRGMEKAAAQNAGNDYTAEKPNPLAAAEMSTEQNYNMIDGRINNVAAPRADLTDGQTYEEIKELAPETLPGEKPSITERLEAAKAEAAKQATPKKSAPGKNMEAEL